MQRWCQHCDRPFEAKRRHALFCSGACRSRASRRYRAGLDANAYPDGARRGRVALGEKTNRELAVELSTAMPA